METVVNSDQVVHGVTFL